MLLAPAVARGDRRLMFWIAAALVLFLLGIPVAMLGFERTAAFYDSLRIAYSEFG